MAGRGRPTWVPTAKERKSVEAMTAYGIPEHKIAAVMGVDPKTLRKHCETEISTGATVANDNVGEFLYQIATGQTITKDSGDPARPDFRSAVTAAIFWMKTRGGWKETSIHEISGLDGEPIKVRMERARERLNGKIDRLIAKAPEGCVAEEP